MDCQPVWRHLCTLAMTRLDRGTPKRLVESAWKNCRDFCALEAGSTHLWTRWLLLRAVGFVYVLIFAGIIVESRAMMWPDGVLPIRAGLDEMLRQSAHPLEAFLRAPGLFWLHSGPAMIVLLEWLGLGAAIALMCNLRPRLALLICWVTFLSFVVTQGFFAATQPDQLMLEVALLCLPLAPAGNRPGLGALAAPRRIAVFAIRWMLIRLMFEAGLAKFVYGAAMWRDLTAMDVMYETAPFPTIIGYWFHQLPHGFHAGEVLITFLAEIPAPRG